VVPADVPDLPLRVVADVTALLGKTINEVRRGQLDPKAANCIGVLAGVLLRAFQDGREDAEPDKPAPLDVPLISAERMDRLLAEVRRRHGLPPVGPQELPGPGPAVNGESAGLDSAPLREGDLRNDFGTGLAVARTTAPTSRC
jgi:hypothetical protein